MESPRCVTFCVYGADSILTSPEADTLAGCAEAQPAVLAHTVRHLPIVVRSIGTTVPYLLPMILSVTVLGNSGGMSPGTVGKKIAEYLEGGRTVAAGQQAGKLVELPSPEGGTVAYYADSAGLRPGRWALGKVGDVDPAAAERAAYLTPVPGGVGPMTIACLLQNAVTCARYRRSDPLFAPA